MIDDQHWHPDEGQRRAAKPHLSHAQFVGLVCAVVVLLVGVLL